MTRKYGAALVLACLVLGGCGGTGINKIGDRVEPAPVVLTMGNVRGTDEELKPFMDAVARLSGGAVRIEVTDGWHKGDPKAEADLVGQVRAGGFDLGVVGARLWNGLGVRSFDALMAPLEVDSVALEKAVLNSDIVPQMLQGPSALGLDGIGIVPGPLRKPAGTKRPLLGPADYKGATIAISPGAVAEHTFKALGATAVPFGFEGAPIARFDGIEQQIASVWGNQYDDTLTSLTADVTLWPRPQTIVANPKVLSDANRELLRKAATAAVPTGVAAVTSQEKESLDTLCRRDKVPLVTAGAARIEALRATLAPVYSWLEEDSRTRRFLSGIRAMRAQAAQAPVPSCAGSAGPVEAVQERTPIDGVYRTGFTRAELAASPLLMDSGEINDDNWGDLKYTFSRGRYIATLRNSVNSGTDGGTYSVKGDILTLKTVNGEVFELRWSLYKDRLTLKRVKGGIGPTPLILKPWKRSGDAP
jgi:TRAP-type C4-dicarboxylate transport system substrate-binding protein